MKNIGKWRAGWSVDLHSLPNIIQVIKIIRMRWVGQWYVQG